MNDINKYVLGGGSLLCFVKPIYRIFYQNKGRFRALGSKKGCVCRCEATMLERLLPVEPMPKVQ